MKDYPLYQLDSHARVTKALQAYNLPFSEGGSCFAISCMHIQALLTEQQDVTLARFQPFDENSLPPDEKRKRSLDQRAFLEAMSLYQSPEEHREVFGPKQNVPSIQDIILSSQIAGSDMLRQKGGMHRLLSQTGIYEKHELAIYFSLLQQVLNKNALPPSVFLLSVLEHAIVVTRLHDCWYIMDANDLPKIIKLEGKDEKEISNVIIASLLNTELVSFNMEWLCCKQDESRFGEALNKLVEHEEWKTLHAVTPQKAILTSDKTRETWAARTAKTGNAALLKNLIDAGADVNHQGPHGKSLLHIASATGGIETMQVLISADANIDSLDSRGSAPLHDATREHQNEAVNVLLEANANVNLATPQGITPLQVAVCIDNREAMRIMLTSGKGVNVNCRQSANMTPLMFAVLNKNLDQVTLLLQYGADVSAKDNYNNTPLLISAYHEHPFNIAKLLIKYRASFATGNKELDAIINGDFGINEVLLDAGAGLTIADAHGDDKVSVLVRKNVSSLSTCQQLVPVRKIMDFKELAHFLFDNDDKRQEFQKRFKDREHELKNGVYEIISDPQKYLSRKHRVQSSSP